MDYGQNNPQNTTPDFFTSGAGTNLENENSFESENNLDLTNTATEWSLPMPDIDQRKVGNRAIASAESLDFSNEKQKDSQEKIPTPVLETPNNPSDSQADSSPTSIAQDTTSSDTFQFEKSHIKTEDHLSETAIAAIDQAKSKLDQDGNVASFYDTIRDMMEANLDNSYNRKLAA